jgi:hypothetical protein
MDVADIGHLTTYVAAVRNTNGSRVTPVTIGFQQRMVGGLVGINTKHPHLLARAGDVHASVPLHATGNDANRSFRTRVLRLRPNEAKRIIVTVSPTKLDGGRLICFLAAASPAPLRARDKSFRPIASAEICDDVGSRATTKPLPLTIELRGPATVRVHSRATYTVTVRNPTSQPVANGEVSISQTVASTHSHLRVTTDWPHVRDSASGGQAALLGTVQPGASLSFHVTEKVPPAARLNGKSSRSSTFSIGLYGSKQGTRLWLFTVLTSKLVP